MSELLIYGKKYTYSDTFTINDIVSHNTLPTTGVLIYSLPVLRDPDVKYIKLKNVSYATIVGLLFGNQSIFMTTKASFIQSSDKTLYNFCFDGDATKANVYSSACNILLRVNGPMQGTITFNYDWGVGDVNMLYSMTFETYVEKS